MKIGAIIQARTSSTRLPAKVLKELPFDSGITMLEQVIRRTKKSNSLAEIIIATTRDDQDNVILALAEKESVKSFKGSKEDVLERYYLAAKKNNLDIIVRVTSDCPCIDPEIIDLLIKKHLSESADYTSNNITKTYPHGLDAEVFNFKILEKAFNEAKSDYEREHVSPYMYKNDKHLFKISDITAPVELHFPDIRITVDTEEDYALLCFIYEHLYEKNNYFNSYDIVSLFKKKPWLKLINKK